MEGEHSWRSKPEHEDSLWTPSILVQTGWEEDGRMQSFPSKHCSRDDISRQTNHRLCELIQEFKIDFPGLGEDDGGSAHHSAAFRVTLVDTQCSKASQRSDLIRIWTRASVVVL
jgi:hypothetical protein